MYGDVAAPNLYAVAQQNCLQEPATRRTVMGQRSGSSSSNDDVERAAPEGFGPLWNVRQTTRHSRISRVATGVRQGHLPWDALYVAEEMPFDGKEERMFVLLAPLPALVLGFLPLRPGHAISSLHGLLRAQMPLLSA
jgi:hypothetical protein